MELRVKTGFGSFDELSSTKRLLMVVHLFHTTFIVVFNLYQPLIL